MFNPTSGPARETFPARERIDAEELGTMIRDGSIIIDNRRRRPLYFDGRFLAARDLTREQNYFLSRQSDMGRALGGGVIHGLMVSAGSTATSISIQAGHGVTSGGEVLVLDAPVVVELTNIPEMQRLDVALGISRIPSESSRNRSGLFILAMRPVEFTANPIASYPTSITGTRTVEDGDIVEAVAVTLIPYLDQSSNTDFLSRRARAAREIFVNRATRGIPSATLPLAMLALDRGVVRWIDPFMVRREVGADNASTIGLGLAPRALREAHLFQYEDHLDEVVRLRATRSLRFAATEHFQCLPSAGHIPAATIDPSDFSQMFFPAEIDVDLSIVPADEVPVLLEESMFLPPIDLTLSGVEQDSTSVQILIPVPRERLRFLLSSLTSTTRTLKPAAPGLVARRKPLESLLSLTLPRTVDIAAVPVTADSVWANALLIPSDRMLWFVRRRNLQYKSDFVGTEVRTAGEESEAEKKLIEQLKSAGLGDRFNALSNVSTKLANGELVTFLGSPKFARSKLMTMAAIRELEEKVVTDQQLEKKEVLAVEDHFSAAQAGEGILQLEAIADEFKSDTFIKTFTDTLLVPAVDRLARLLPVELREKFARRMIEAAAAGNLSDFIVSVLKDTRAIDPQPPKVISEPTTKADTPTTESTKAADTKTADTKAADTKAADASRTTSTEATLRERLRQLNLLALFEDLNKAAPPEKRGELVGFLAAPKFTNSALMQNAVMRKLQVRLASLRDFARAFDAVQKDFSDPQAGTGIAKLERSAEFRNEKIVAVIAASNLVLELDEVLRPTFNRVTLSTVSAEILKVAQTGDNREMAKEITSVIRKLSAEIK